MWFNPSKTAALVIAVLGLYGGAASADTIRDVKCADGRTVRASGTQSNTQACQQSRRQYDPILIRKRIDRSTPSIHPQQPQDLQSTSNRL